MRDVHIEPLPANLRGTVFRRMHDPIFNGYSSAPTHEEIELALFEELDPESQEWQGGMAFVERLRAKLR